MVILLFGMACPIYSVASQPTTTVVVSPSTPSPTPGETFHVTVSLTDVQNLYGLEVILKWDPSVLRALGADVRLGVETFSDGILHISPSSEPVLIAENNLTQSEGKYSLVAASVSSASSFSGSGNIVILTFEAVQIGNSVLDLESQLQDYPPSDRDPRLSLPIAHLSQDSSVVVKKSSGTEPSPTDTTPPKIDVVSPVNQTYSESSVSLIFNLDETVSWAGYSVDGKENVTVMGNVTIGGLPNGLHTVRVCANDTSGNMGFSEIRSFSVEVAAEKPGSFPVLPLVVALSVVFAVLVCAALLVYFKQRKWK